MCIVYATKFNDDAPVFNLLGCISVGVHLSYMDYKAAEHSHPMSYFIWYDIICHDFIRHGVICIDVICHVIMCHDLKIYSHVFSICLI